MRFYDVKFNFAVETITLKHFPSDWTLSQKKGKIIDMCKLFSDRKIVNFYPSDKNGPQ